MKNSIQRKHLYIGGLALALGAVAFSARAQYSNAVLSLNPILYYHLNDTAPVPGNVWTNDGTAGKAGTLMGLNLPTFQVLPGALAAETNIGGAGFSGPGPNSYGPLPYSPNIDPSKGNPQAPFTVEGWYNPASGGSSVPNGDGCVINYLNISGRTGWILYQDATVGWDWRLYANQGGTFAARVTSGTNDLPQANTWYHVVLVWDGTNATMYTNGVPVGPPTPAPTFVPATPGRIESLAIRSDFNYEWGGTAQEVAIYTNALSASNIMAHYQNGTNAAPAQRYEDVITALNPLLYWRLDDPGYTSTTGVAPVPFQPGQPTAANLGSLGSPDYDATYGPGTVADVAGVPYAGFGSDSHSVQFHGLGDSVSGDYGTVQIPALTNLTSVTNFTFTGWLYNNSFQAGASPLMWQRAGDNTTSAMGIWFFDASQLETMWNDQDYGVGFGNQDPPIGDWSFVSSVWTPNGTTIYLNGVAKSITDTNHAPRDFSVGAIFLGADVYSDQNLNGRLQEVAMFTNALSAAQIQSLYNAGQPAPQIVSVTQTPPGPINYEQQTITYSVTAFGAGTLGYEWFFNGQSLTNQSRSNLVLTAVHTNNSGSYFVVVTNAFGAVTSSVVVLDVVAGPPVIVQQPVPALTLFVNGGVTLRVGAVGTVPITYQWEFNGAPISGATSSNLTLTGLLSSNAGTYNVIATNPHGSTPTADEVLTIIAVPTNYPSAMMSLGPQAYWRLNETNGTTAYDYAGGNNGTIAGGVAVGQPGPALPGLSNTTSAAYMFDGTTGVVNTPLLVNGVAGTFVALINTTNPTDLVGILDARGGPGGSCSMELYTDGLTLQYTWANQANTYAYPPTVAMTGLQAVQNTWCFAVVSVGADETILYMDNGSGLQSETNEVPSLSVTNTGPMLIGRDTAWFYFPGGIDEAAYFNRALTPDEVTALDHVLFTNAIVGAPQILTQPAAQTAFAGSPATLTVTAIGALPLSYQWQFDNTNIPGATSQTLVLPSVNFPNAGSYQVVVSNSVGSSNSESALLTVLQAAANGSLTNGLVAHYTFDSNFLDSSGLGNNGFGVNSPAFVPGKFGSAVQVVDNGASPAVNQYVNLGDPTDLQFNYGSTFTIAWWVNYTVPCGDIPMIATAISSTYQAGWSFADSLCDDHTGGNMEISFATGSGDFTAPAAYPIDDGQWHHVAVTADLINDDAFVYIDGTQITSYYLNGKGLAQPTITIPAQSTPATVYPGYPIIVGNDPTGFYSGYCAAGGYTIDDMGIWNRLLAPSEVTAIYSAGTNGFAIGGGPGQVQLIARLIGAHQLQLTWTEGTLESAAALTGPWTAVTNAPPPTYTVTPAGTTFYRVQQ